jgi:hypothetical protein
VPSEVVFVRNSKKLIQQIQIFHCNSPDPDPYTRGNFRTRIEKKNTGLDPQLAVRVREVIGKVRGGVGVESVGHQWST